MTTSRHRTPEEEARIWGEALRRLREASRTPEGRKVTQAIAASQFGVKRQAWNNYEQGERLLINRPDVQQRLAEAVGRTREDLEAARAEVLGEPPPASRSFAPREAPLELPILGRVRASAQGPQIYDVNPGEPESVVDISWLMAPTTRTLRVAGDSMTGYVESGDLVIYDTKIWPKRGEGCVVELQNGDVYVKEYLDTSQGVLRVKQRFPDEVMTFPMSDVKGVYWIRLRG